MRETLVLSSLYLNTETPISGINLSSSQLLMSRRLRSNLLMISSLLSPQVNTNIQKQLEKRQQKQR